MEEILVVIPARGGSKGLPGKNIKNLCGMPLITYSIDVARAITSDDNICVSTDDQKIVQHGEKLRYIRDSFFHYDEYYVWDEHYVNLFKEMHAEPSQFKVAVSPSLHIDSKAHNIVSFMEQEELDYLASLSFPMKAYRGMCNAEYASGDLGISWTDSKGYASNYVFFSKNNNREKDGKIAERTIERKDVFAAWGVNGNKKELIILT